MKGTVNATRLNVDDITSYIRERKDTSECLSIIWIRCIHGDEDNSFHSGKRATYPRERSLFKRVIALVTSWMVKHDEASIPSFDQFKKHVLDEMQEKGMTDAGYVSCKCLRGDPLSTSDRGRYPREKSLLKRVLSMLREYVASRECTFVPSRVH